MKIDIVELGRSGEILRMEKKQFLSRGEFNFALGQLKRKGLPKVSPEEVEHFFAEYDKKGVGGIGIG